MQRGAVLYRDIWDNKPPLLYLIYAIIPTLLWAKITATAFVLGTTYFTYKISKNYLASLLTGCLLSLPLLEGTIANAELYFTLPIVIAAYLILKNKFPPLIIGALLTIAFLLKVPAAFDFAGIFLAYIVIHKKIKAPFLASLVLLASLALLLFYFYLNHGLNDFIIAAFSQNSSYVSVAAGPLSKLSNPLFIKAFLVLLASLALLVLFAKKRITKELLFLTLWFAFSLYGALLSGRPYMHYLLQIVPPAIILFFYIIRHSKIFLIPYIFILIIIAKMFTGAFYLGNIAYYQNWFDYMSERKTWSQFVNSFDSRTLNSYNTANFIIQNSNPNDKIFVWGDAAFIYVISNRTPATKFIQAHHLTTINPKNYQLVIQKLEKEKPKLILVSRPGHFFFPELEDLIKKKYHYVATFEDLYVYQIIK